MNLEEIGAEALRRFIEQSRWIDPLVKARLLVKSETASTPGTPTGPKSLEYPSRETGRVFRIRVMKTYVAQCACGWTSTPKPTIGKANLAGAAHVRFAPQYRFGHGISVEVKK